MTDDEIVWVASARSAGATCRAYHTDPHCRLAENAQKLWDKQRHLVDDRLEECAVCAGTMDYNPRQGPSLERRLRELDPEDLDV